MPIAFGNATDLGNNGLSFIAADPPIIGPRAIHTAPHTLGAGSNAIFVAVEGAFPPVDDITSVTYGGYALIEVAKYVPQIEDNQRCLYLYGLIDPPAGTHDVVTECEGNHYLAVLAMDYSGATAEDISVIRNVALQGSTELTTTIDVIRPDSWVVLLESGYDEDVARAGPGVVGPRTHGEQWGSPSFFDSGAGVPAGDYQFTTYRDPPGENYPGILHLAIAFAPADSTPPAPGFNRAADLGHNNFISPVLRASYTLGAGSNLLFVAFVGDPVRGFTSGALPQLPARPSQPLPAVDDVLWVRWGSQDLSLAAKITMPPEDWPPEVTEHERWGYIYYLENPLPGTRQIEIQCGPLQSFIAAAAADYRGARLTGINAWRQNFFPYAQDAPFTTEIDPTSPCWVFLYTDQNTDPPTEPPPAPADDSCVLRIVAGGFTPGSNPGPWGRPAIFDSNRAVPAGAYAISTEQGNRYPGTGIVHLAVAFEVEAPTAPVAVDLDPVVHAPVHASGTLAARVFARPTALALDAAVHPVAPARGDLPVQIFSGAFPIVALDPATFPPVIARGDLPAQIFGTAAPIIALDPATFPLHLAAELGVRIIARPTGLALDAVVHPLGATGRLAARIYARPLAMHFIPFPQTFDAVGRLPVRVNLSSLLSATIEHLRRNVPALGGRIAGAADYVTALQSDNATMPLPAGYVLPLDQEANGNLVMVGLEQVVTRTFGVVVEFATAADRRGQAPAMRYDEIQEQLCRALLLWQPQAAIGGPGTGRVPNHQGFYLAGGRMLDFNRARLFYQWEFALDWQLFSAG
jgi:hypothetical protein